MESMEIKNYIIKDKEITHNISSMTIPNKGIIGVYGKNALLVESFLMEIAGINRSSGDILYNNVAVFDSDAYFKQRIYMDFSKKYTNSISPTKIADYLFREFRIDLDVVHLNNLIQLFQVRLECNISGICEFTSIGNTLINLAIASSMKTKTLIAHQPLCFLEDKEKIQKAITFLLQHYQQERLIISINEMLLFKNKLTHVILFTDYNKIKLLDTKQDAQILLIRGDARHIYEYISEEDRLFYTFQNNVFEILCLDRLTQQDKRALMNKHTKIKSISVYDINTYC